MLCPRRSKKKTQRFHLPQNSRSPLFNSISCLTSRCILLLLGNFTIPHQHPSLPHQTSPTPGVNLLYTYFQHCCVPGFQYRQEGTAWFLEKTRLGSPQVEIQWQSWSTSMADHTPLQEIEYESLPGGSLVSNLAAGAFAGIMVRVFPQCFVGFCGTNKPALHPLGACGHVPSGCDQSIQ